MGALEDSEFKEEKLTMQNALRFKLFHRDAVTVLKKQIACLSIRDLKTIPTKSHYFSILMDAELEKVLFTAVERQIKTHICNELTLNL